MKSKLTTLCYIEKENCYLMLHRVKKEQDINKNKWIGVGGHFEEGESPEDCLLREVFEETGLTLTSYRFRGIVTFCSENYPTEYMCLYTADGYTGTLTECTEGELAFVAREEITKLKLWDGDRLFLELLKEERPFFSLKLCYHEDGTWYRAVLDGRELELFDICDEKGEPTGEVMERGMVHHYGKMHRTAHIWIVNRMPDGSYQVLLQKRSKKKDSYPGCYDISSAGHIHAGDSYLPSARRELAEELGIEAGEEELQLIGYHRADLRTSFYGKPFLDQEISAVYLYEKPVRITDLILQESEVEGAVFFELEEALSRVRNGTLPNCIYEDELQMVKDALISMGKYQED